jgi:hypothetical protein
MQLQLHAIALLKVTSTASGQVWPNPVAHLRSPEVTSHRPIFITASAFSRNHGRGRIPTPELYESGVNQV